MLRTVQFACTLPKAEADALNRIGSLHQFLGKRPEAHKYYQQALAAYRNAGSHRGQAVTLTNIGNYLNSLGEWQKASEHSTVGKNTVRYSLADNENSLNRR